jgi:4,5-DOPA dioxygenase extradiol
LAGAAGLHQFFRKEHTEMEPDKKMPVLFIGHGSPMNAIEQNRYHLEWQRLGRELPKPTAILCVSAHWQTVGTRITAMEKPRTIYDFGGFPEALYKATYPAPGSPVLAAETIKTLQSTQAQEDHSWGLDHGTWSVLLPMYPLADIPVYQMSLDMNQSPQRHFELGRELSALRKKGVLIIGSGNMVHNLGRMQWTEGAYDWAIEFDRYCRERIEANDLQSLIQFEKQGTAARLSIPTAEHYLPLLYVLGLKDADEPFCWFNEHVTMGSISMRSLLIG